MKPSVQQGFQCGVEVPGAPPGGGADYYIVDADTGLYLVEQIFTSSDEAQAYLDQHMDDILRRGLPPLDPETLALLIKSLPVFEARVDTGSMNAEECARFARIMFRWGKQVADPALRQRVETIFERLSVAPNRHRTAS